MPHVADNADHTAFLGARPGNVPANRILARPERLREGLVDQHHGFLAGHVACREVAPGQEPDAHSCGVAFADQPDERQRILTALVGHPFGPRAPGAVAPEGQRVGDGRALDARRLADTTEDVVHMREALSRRDPAVGIDPDRGRARRVEPHFYFEHADEAADQEAGADQQDAGECDLRHHQRVAYEGPFLALGRSAARVLERAGHIGPRRLQRRRQAEDNARN